MKFHVIGALITACLPLRARIRLCADYDVSIFAARHNYPPDDRADPNGNVEERIRYWVNE